MSIIFFRKKVAKNNLSKFTISSCLKKLPNYNPHFVPGFIVFFDQLNAFNWLNCMI